jgi:hypothetical protein
MTADEVQAVTRRADRAAAYYCDPQRPLRLREHVLRESAADVPVLLAEIDRLQAQLDALDRKVHHGCADANCAACEAAELAGVVAILPG